ncbi:MAG: 3-deoxy-manno-octulosonate cytidylyltransferase [Arenimonas sp.]|nr:3-deoxy-manno-octulosonate cytidylyltransferase [Arenimonas sp.]MBP7917559.1 3-deoxy-manno-octulosonate cytidylyltransferase [Arenimonas sp.]
MTDFIVAIPARFASTRLPGKPLSLIGGKAMIQHVAERALAAGAKQVVIATDDERIVRALDIQGVQVVMTSIHHQSGTDRLAECAERLAWTDGQIVVNLQGDEPFAPAVGIRQVAELLSASASPMATLSRPIADEHEFNDPNAVKVVRSMDGSALYFSRAPIPWPRDDARAFSTLAQRHIGIYAYRTAFLKRFSRLQASSLERCEALEQLRALENGFSIAVAESLAEFPAGVDTSEDLERANLHWLNMQTGTSA